MPSTAALQLTHRPDLEILTGRWLADATLPEFQAEYAAILAASQQHRAWRWLLDVRRRPVPPAGAAEWLANEWLPPVAELAQGQLRIAYLVSPLRVQVIQADGQLATTVAAMLATPHAYEARMFDDEAAAVRWLTA